MKYAFRKIVIDSPFPTTQCGHSCQTQKIFEYHDHLHARISAFKLSSKYRLLFDGNHCAGGQHPFFVLLPGQQWANPTGVSGPAYAADVRHEYSANELFVDGHVASQMAPAGNAISQTYDCRWAYGEDWNK